MDKKKSGIGLRYALAGLVTFFGERNAKIHGVAAVLVIMAGFYLGLDAADWLWLTVAITLVFVSEMFNSAIERLCDTLHPGHNPGIGKLKDISAGAVLTAVAFALVVAGIIFVPRIIEMVSG